MQKNWLSDAPPQKKIIPHTKKLFQKIIFSQFQFLQKKLTIKSQKHLAPHQKNPPAQKIIFSQFHLRQKNYKFQKKLSQN